MMDQPEILSANNVPGKKKNRTWTIVKVVVSSILLILLITQVKWQAFFAVLTSISLIYLLYPLIAYYVNVGLSVIKWRALLENMAIIDKFGKLFAIYLTGAFYNNFLPSTIGGDGYRFLEMRSNHPGKSEQVFSSILLERGFGYLVLIIVNLVFAVYFRDLVYTQPWLFVIEIALVGGLALGTLLWLFRDRFANALGQVRFLNKIFQFLHYLDIHNPKVVAISFGTSLLFVLISGVWLAVYYWSVGANVNWLYAIYVSTVVNIVGAVPITLNGLGVVELLQVQLMGLVGVPVETVLVVSLMSRVLLAVFSLPGGLLSFR
jgi:glycosyltransferase 2 family protein